LLQQPPVLDRVGRIHRQHAFLGIVRRLKVLAPDEVDDDGLHHHDDDNHRREMIDELIEGKPGLRADQDIGRVADQRRGAANIGGDDFRKQIRIGRHS
jgi:hypothetical protein